MAKQAAEPQTADQSKLFLLAVGALVVLGLGAVAIIAANQDGNSSTDTASSDEVAEVPLTDGAETATISVDGTPLPVMPQGVQIGDENNDPAYGIAAPTLTGTAFDGSEVAITNDGTPKAIYFVAHWCPHCQAEIPMIQDLLDDGKLPEGLEVYAVSTAVDKGRGNYPPSDWLRGEGFTPTVIRDDEAVSALEAFGATSFPFAVYLNGNNEVVARTAGSTDAEQTESLWQAAVSAP